MDFKDFRIFLCEKNQFSIFQNRKMIENVMKILIFEKLKMDFFSHKKILISLKSIDFILENPKITNRSNFFLFNIFCPVFFIAMGRFFFLQKHRIREESSKFIFSVSVATD